MKLSTARYIHQKAKTEPLFKLQAFGGSGGSFALIFADDMYPGLSLAQMPDATWFIQGSEYYQYRVFVRGAKTRDEAIQQFVNKQQALKDLVKNRKYAARVVAKFGEGPIVTKEGGTWVARIDGEVVAKAAQPHAARVMADRYEKQQQK